MSFGELASRNGFAERLSWHFEGDNVERADRAVRDYYQHDHGHHFTGSRFEDLVDTDPNRITASDLVAVSMLSVTVPPSVAVWLLTEPGASRVAELLADVPIGVDIWEAPELVANESALWRLWEVLETADWPNPRPGNGMGQTIISKVLAAKRPRLVPITDSVVRKALPSAAYWDDFARALADPQLRELIAAATTAAPLQLSMLRRIDIVVWMLHR